MPRSSYSLSPIPYTLILLLAAFFSFLALGNARRFHPDEAYYMTSARHAAVNGDWWLLAEPVDKPPLTFYLNALALVCCAVEADANGVLQLDALKGEFAGRFPSLLLSILLVAATMQLTKTITRNNQTAYIAGLLLALSPLRIVFAATAFTDMPMLCFGVLALLMAARGKATWAGCCFILSFAAKPQVIFYLPLVLAFLFFKNGRLESVSPRKIIAFLMPILIGMGLLWLWDMGRIGQGAVSIWALGQARYTATTFTPLSDYPARFAEFWATLQYSFGNGLITAGFIIFGLIFSKQWLLRLWFLVFMTIHLILTLNLFDRNLIVLLPLLAILLGDAIVIFSGVISCSPTKPPKFPLLACGVGGQRVGFSLRILKFFSLIYLCVSALSFFAFVSAWGNLPIGGDKGRHDGIEELAEYLNSKPVATVLYDTWLDWELDYYMGQWTDKRRVFYPTVELLLEDALALDESGGRYLLVPVWIDASAWLLSLSENGFRVSLDREFANFHVWELLPP